MHLNESLLVIEFRDMNVRILALIRHYEMQKCQRKIHLFSMPAQVQLNKTNILNSNFVS